MTRRDPPCNKFALVVNVQRLFGLQETERKKMGAPELTLMAFQ